MDAGKAKFLPKLIESRKLPIKCNQIKLNSFILLGRVWGNCDTPELWLKLFLRLFVAHFWSVQFFERPVCFFLSILIQTWTNFRYRTLSWNRTMPPCLFISWSRTQMRHSVLITRLCTKSASERSS